MMGSSPLADGDSKDPALGYNDPKPFGAKHGIIYQQAGVTN